MRVISVGGGGSVTGSLERKWWVFLYKRRCGKVGVKVVNVNICVWRIDDDTEGRVCRGWQVCG